MIAAFIGQPFVQLVKRAKAPAFGKKTLPDHADLIFHLPLLPAGTGGTGHRGKQVMGCKVLEPAVEYPILAHQHLVDHRLQVVVNTPAANPAEKLEGPDMGIKHHFQGLTGIGYTERLAAIAKTELGDLYLRLHASDFYPLVAPVELKGVAGFIGQRDIGGDRRRAGFPFPGAHITAERIVATLVSFALQMLKKKLSAAPMGCRFAAILPQQFDQAFNKISKLGVRLRASFVLLVGFATTDNVSDGVAGKFQLAGYRTNFLPVSKICLTNFSNGLHVQHLLLDLLSLVESKE